MEPSACTDCGALGGTHTDPHQNPATGASYTFFFGVAEGLVERGRPALLCSQILGLAHSDLRASAAVVGSLVQTNGAIVLEGLTGYGAHQGS
jgi:hypothetical protein